LCAHAQPVETRQNGRDQVISASNPATTRKTSTSASDAHSGSVTSHHDQWMMPGEAQDHENERQEQRADLHFLFLPDLRLRGS
jgi:hypothetical protein